MSKHLNITLSVPNMHCDSCPRLIDLTLSDVPGVINALSSLETKTTDVIFDPQLISLNQIIKSIGELGYTATPQK